MLAGCVVLLAERAKWAEGRFLAVDLDLALEPADTRAGELETIAALFSADALVPDEGQAVLDELVDKSHKHAVGVSKELRERHPPEHRDPRQRGDRTALATPTRPSYSGRRVDARQLTSQCLRYLYRLLVLLYAESRPELGILPVDDEAYLAGYSLDRLRELTLVELDTDDARNGPHLDESLRLLFGLVNDGYHAEARPAGRSSTDDATDGRRSTCSSPALDAALFDAGSDPAARRVHAPQRGAPAGAAPADAQPKERKGSAPRLHLLRPARHQPARRGLRGPDVLHRVLRRPRTSTRWPRTATRTTAPGSCPVDRGRRVPPTTCS